MVKEAPKIQQLGRTGTDNIHITASLRSFGLLIFVATSSRPVLFPKEITNFPNMAESEASLGTESDNGCLYREYPSGRTRANESDDAAQ